MLVFLYDEAMHPYRDGFLLTGTLDESPAVVTQFILRVEVTNTLASRIDGAQMASVSLGPVRLICAG